MTKQCSKCNMNKSTDDFYNTKRNKDHKSGWCKQCTRLHNSKRDSTPEGRKHRSEYRRKWRNEHPDSYYLYNYGLTDAQRREMYLQQNGCCKICGKPSAYTKIHTDHDHVTGIVRGLLCMSCNTRLDWYAKLRAEINVYLERKQ